jgi:hypothetical protein
MSEAEGGKPSFLKGLEFEDDPSVIAEGEEKLHAALQIMTMHVDAAFSFIMYRFNRVGIKHPKLDAVIYLDKNSIPTLGINYARFIKLTTVAQISVIEHQVGHLLCGHLGDRLGYELKQYCENKYGEKMGRKIYYLTIETIADMFVTYPGALKDNGRPHYDVRKLGLPRWDYTLNALHRVEELLDPPQNGGGDNPALDKLLDQLAQKMRNSAQWQKGDKPDPKDSKAHKVKQLKDDGDTETMPDGSELGEEDSPDEETGGVETKDLIFVPNKKDAMIAEDKTREIVRQAMENTQKSRGYMAGDCSQFIDSADEQPVVPWYQRLNHIISSGISHERRITKKRINRRNPDFGFGRVHQNVTTICFVIDTSGSMAERELSHVNAELASIVQNTENPVHILHCDAEVAKCEEYRHGMKLEEFWGRGGTSFEPALEYIRDEMPEKPDLIVYFTDGYGGNKLNDDEPIIHPSFADMLWILTPNGMDEERFRNNITRQGEVIKVEEWV